MRRRRSERVRLAAMGLAALAWLGGCASVERTPGATVDVAASRSAGVLSVEEAERSRERIAIGKSAKADVLAALGKAAAVLSFDSGFEVWVYRIRAPDPAKQADAEYVLLFAPSGTLAKARVRPGGVMGHSAKAAD